MQTEEKLENKLVPLFCYIRNKSFPDFIIASPILKFKPIVRINQIRNFFFLLG